MSTRALRIAAILTLVLAVANALAFPASADLADGWITPILAFELAREASDLAFLAGPENAELRAAMDSAHLVDMLFPVAYGALLGGSAWRPESVWGWVGAVAGALCVPLDAFENVVLMGITAELDAGDEVTLLPRLFVATWLKWGAVATGLVAFATRYGQERIAPLAASLGALGIFVAFVTGLPVAGEVMGACVAVAFGGLAFRAFRLHREALAG